MSRMWKCIVAGLGTMLLLASLGNLAGCARSGSVWELETSLPQEDHLRGVWCYSASDVFAVGWDGTILHYDGSSWNLMNSGTDSILEGVWGSSSSDVFAVGNGGTILHYAG